MEISQRQPLTAMPQAPAKPSTALGLLAESTVDHSLASQYHQTDLNLSRFAVAKNTNVAVVSSLDLLSEPPAADEPAHNLSLFKDNPEFFADLT